MYVSYTCLFMYSHLYILFQHMNMLYTRLCVYGLSCLCELACAHGLTLCLYVYGCVISVLYESLCVPLCVHLPVYTISILWSWNACPIWARPSTKVQL